MQQTVKVAPRARLSICGVIVAAAVGFAVPAGAADAPRVAEDGTIHVPAFDLPPSSLLDEETRAALAHARDFLTESIAASKTCPSAEGASRADMAAIRKCQAEAYSKMPSYKKVRDRYKVIVTGQEIGGLYTDVITPAEGVARTNEKRVLINVHGGGSMTGSRTFNQLESIPIASVGRIKVISVDYRMEPEYTFPAGSEDVAAVYRALLKTYQPKDIGIYGCSAGGLQTAQAVAWFQKEGLPMPGAVGMFCAAGSYWLDGDSGYFGSALLGRKRGTVQDAAYFKDADPNDPLVFPLRSDRLLAKFPPSLLIGSTRDYALSSIVQMHSRLVALGVDADLHVWEGLEHGFFFDPDLPQSREVYTVITRFFDRHLGQR